mmetsp:Transcript_29824/g.59046  ORF Transcript_29824/g.59046 Transcript_29824/m.59046 type:complete len:594 (+) Transcript_29824:76-1857(+)
MVNQNTRNRSVATLRSPEADSDRSVRKSWGDVASSNAVTCLLFGLLAFQICVLYTTISQIGLMGFGGQSHNKNPYTAPRQQGKTSATSKSSAKTRRKKKKSIFSRMYECFRDKVFMHMFNQMVSKVRQIRQAFEIVSSHKHSKKQNYKMKKKREKGNRPGSERENLLFKALKYEIERKGGVVHDSLGVLGFTTNRAVTAYNAAASFSLHTTATAMMSDAEIANAITQGNGDDHHFQNIMLDLLAQVNLPLQGEAGFAISSNSWIETSAGKGWFSSLKNTFRKSSNNIEVGSDGHVYANKYYYGDWDTVAPCGAMRGLGFVKPQVEDNVARNVHSNGAEGETMIRVPLSMQTTREKALETLERIIPDPVKQTFPPSELDDAVILTLFLAHERARGLSSPWRTYIDSLPTPSCGYLRSRESISLAVTALHDAGVDAYGWFNEVNKARENADRIVLNLSRYYGSYIYSLGVKHKPSFLLQWALCHVTSRGIVADPRHGRLRLVPILDMVNHDNVAGGFDEDQGKNKTEAWTESLDGSLLLKNTRNGRNKVPKPGRELFANYNLNTYSRLDSFINLVFVPYEKLQPWSHLEAGLRNK